MKKNYWIWIHPSPLSKFWLSSRLMRHTGMNTDRCNAPQNCVSFWSHFTVYTGVLILFTTAASIMLTLIHWNVQREIVLNTIDLTQYKRGADMYREKKTSTRVRCGWDPSPLAASNKQGSVTLSELRVPFKYVFVMQQFSTRHLSAYMYG